MNNNIVLDKNIVLDIISGRSRRSAVLEILKNYDTHYISTHTFATCFYILRKQNLSKYEIYNHLVDFEIIEIHVNDCHLAYDIAQNIDDIEDCLELLTAKRNKAKIITADHKMAFKYGDLFSIVVV